MAARPSPIYLLAGGLSWPLVRLLFRLRATGLEHLPKTGGYVLAANHTSNFDPWALGIPLFPRRWLRFMAKSELYWWPLGALLDAYGPPVEVSEDSRETTERLMAEIRRLHEVP